MKLNVSEHEAIHLALGHKCSEENPHEAFAAYEKTHHAEGAFTLTCENCGKKLHLGISKTDEMAVEEATGRPTTKQTDESLNYDGGSE